MTESRNLFPVNYCWEVRKLNEPAYIVLLNRYCNGDLTNVWFNVLQNLMLRKSTPWHNLQSPCYFVDEKTNLSCVYVNVQSQSPVWKQFPWFSQFTLLYLLNRLRFLYVIHLSTIQVTQGTPACLHDITKMRKH